MENTRLPDSGTYGHTNLGQGSLGGDRLDGLSRARDGNLPASRSHRMEPPSVTVLIHVIAETRLPKAKKGGVKTTHGCTIRAIRVPCQPRR